MTETKLVNAVGTTWDACIRIIPAAVGERVKAVVFSPSGALIFAHGEHCMKVFDAMTGMNRATFDRDISLCSVAFSPNDGFLASGHWDGTINVWDVQTGTIFRTLQGSSSARSVMFSPCGTMIASGNADWTVQIWNILLDGYNCVFQGHSGIVTHVCWLATWIQVVSASQDLTVRIWDAQKQMCLKVFQYCHPVTAISSTRGLLLTSTNGIMNIYDSQSCDIMHIIRSIEITHSHLSTDGGKVLLASSSSGDIWDITTRTLTHVGSIKYHGEQATISPDGTCVASIYGKFVKIWKTNAGYNHHEASTHAHDKVNNVYISPDEQLVILKSREGLNILDATTHQTLFRYPVTVILSIVFSLDSAFVAFLSLGNTVHIWNACTHHHKSIDLDRNVFDIALSPDGSQLASLTQSLSQSQLAPLPSHMKLWDLKTERCIANLELDGPLWEQAQISFSTNATSVYILKNSGMQSWCISPNHNLTENPIKNGDGTKSWLTLNHEGTKLPMVLVPTMTEWPNWDASVPCQSYCCDMDDEWILDQDGRHVLWIPPDERPRKFFCFKNEKKVLVHTEGGKVYYVHFS